MIAAVLLATVAAPVWQGVWQGSVGALPVRVCLARRGEAGAVGSYFYTARLRTIRLEQHGGSREWVEGWGGIDAATAPRWRFEAIGAQALAGSWRGGGRMLPFRLTRVAAGGDEPCGSLAFNRPRLRPLAVSAARATADGVGYTRLTVDPGPAFADVGLRTFALDGDTPATRRINARLRRDMPLPVAATVKAEDGWYLCVASGLAARGADGEYDLTIAPMLVTPRWVAATESVGYDCGGAHPDTAVTSLVFDRRTGGEIDLHDWLGPAALERRRDGTYISMIVRPALRRVILAHAPAPEPDCRGVAAAAEFWDIGLARAGLRFTPGLAHVDQACADEVLVPWRRLAPFLSPAGRAGMATLAAPVR